MATVSYDCVIKSQDIRKIIAMLTKSKSSEIRRNFKTAKQNAVALPSIPHSKEFQEVCIDE